MDEAVAVVVEETGKSAHDALTGDVMVTLEHLRFYERHAARLLRERQVGKPAFLFQGARFTQICEPHGVVLVFAPWNYPLQLAAVPMLTALFAGNAVLLKCSERTPRTAGFLAALCEQAGLPEGLVQISWEGPEEAVALLDASPDFCFFTGSNRGGRSVLERASARMIPAAMELGGSHPALVFDSCRLERAADGLVYGAFANAGHVCTGVKRIYVQSGSYERFRKIFLERLRNLPPAEVGSARGLDGQGIRSQMETVAASGCTVHDCGAGFVIEGPAADRFFLADEIFGPVVSMMSFEDEADALRLAAASPFALAASVWTGDAAQTQRLARALPAGAVSINDVIRNAGNPYAPFGGNGQSGFGRYHGEEGLRTFSRTRAIMAVSGRKPREIHWFPHTPETYGRVRQLMMLRHGAGSLLSRVASLMKGRSI